MSNQEKFKMVLASLDSWEIDSILVPKCEYWLAEAVSQELYNAQEIDGNNARASSPDRSSGSGYSTITNEEDLQDTFTYSDSSSEPSNPSQVRATDIDMEVFECVLVAPLHGDKIDDFLDKLRHVKENFSDEGASAIVANITAEFQDLTAIHNPGGILEKCHKTYPEASPDQIQFLILAFERNTVAGLDSVGSSRNNASTQTAFSSQSGD